MIKLLQKLFCRHYYKYSSINYKIGEEYVSFETAKLLKEKGFSCEEIRHVYCYYEEEDDYCYEKLLDYEKFDSKKMIAVPTLQTAMRWLREEKNIDIDITTIHTMDSIIGKLSRKYQYRIEHINAIEHNLKMRHKWFNSYEQACESAIKYCLENLI